MERHQSKLGFFKMWNKTLAIVSADKKISEKEKDVKLDVETDASAQRNLLLTGGESDEEYHDVDEVDAKGLAETNKPGFLLFWMSLNTEFFGFNVFGRHFSVFSNFLQLKPINCRLNYLHLESS